MRYAMLIYETPEDFEVYEGDEESLWSPWQAYYKALVAAGVYVDGSPLQPIATSTTVRLREGQRQVQDGPYADTKEQLGGFIILEVPSLDAALDWAARCPVAATGAVEVRPLNSRIHGMVTGQDG